MIAKIHGFTLIELSITIVVISIIAVIALPNYSEYVKRASRIEAVTALLDAANKQEQYYVDNREYTTLRNLQIAEYTESGNFKLTSKVQDGNSFTITATPVSGAVKDDKDCAQLLITDTGLKSATGSKETSYCWGHY